MHSQVLRKLDWPETLASALLECHSPTSDSKCGPESRARMCLAFHELTVQQAQLELTHWRFKNPNYGSEGGQ